MIATWITSVSLATLATLAVVFFAYTIYRDRIHDIDEGFRASAIDEQLDNQRELVAQQETSIANQEEIQSLARDYQRVVQILVKRGCDPEVVSDVIHGIFNADPNVASMGKRLSLFGVSDEGDSDSADPSDEPVSPTLKDS